MDVVSQNQFINHQRDFYALQNRLEDEIKTRTKLEREMEILTTRYFLLLDLIKPLLSPMELRKLGVKLNA